MMPATLLMRIAAARLLVLAALLLLPLPGCTTSAKDPINGVDAAPDLRSNADTAASSGVPDANGTSADAVGADTVAPPADAAIPEAGQGSADADAQRQDAVPARADATARETGLVPPDVAAPDGPGIRADSAAPEAPSSPDGASRDADATLRDAVPAAEASGVGPETSVSSCKLDGGAPSLVRLTSLELKTILDSAEDPFLINVKGASIGKIPGTDAVLAGDIPGIEALVGGDHCANIILYCQSGNTSQSVAAQLIAKGYVHVRDLVGGITDWKNAGYPTE